MTFLAPLITRFLRDHMPRQRGYSPHSCETYAHGFRLLFTYAAGRLRTKPSQLHIEQLDAALIMDFLGHIERERGNGATTRNLRLATIKTFMRYVEFQVPSALEQIGQIHAIPAKRHDQKLVRHLVMDEVRAILNAPDLTARLGVRDRAIDECGGDPPDHGVAADVAARRPRAVVLCLGACRRRSDRASEAACFAHPNRLEAEAAP